MADVFISYAKNEREPTERLAQFLHANGYSVWWDKNILASENFRDVIVDEITKARAAIVIWTASAVKSEWVISEAQLARNQKKLLPLRVAELHPDLIPPPFGVLHTELVEQRELVIDALENLGVHPGGKPEGPGSSNAEEYAFWEHVKASTNPQEIREFFTHFPGSTSVFAMLARKRLVKLEDDAWAACQTATEYAAIDRFLALYPESLRRPDALKLRKTLYEAEAEKAWQAVAGAADTPPLRAFLAAYGDSARAADAKAAIAAIERRLALADAQRRAWEPLKASTDAVAVLRYLKDNPGGVCTEDALKRLAGIPAQLENAAWAVVEGSSNADLMAGFAAAFPGSTRVVTGWRGGRARPAAAKAAGAGPKLATPSRAAAAAFVAEAVPNPRRGIGGWLLLAVQYGVIAAIGVMLIDRFQTAQSYVEGSVAPWDPYPILWSFIAGLLIVALITGRQQWSVITGRRSPVGLIAQNACLAGACVAGFAAGGALGGEHKVEATLVLSGIAAGLIWLAGALSAQPPASGAGGFDRGLSIVSLIVAVGAGVAVVLVLLFGSSAWGWPLAFLIGLMAAFGGLHWLTGRGRPYGLLVAVPALAYVGFAAFMSSLGATLPLFEPSAMTTVMDTLFVRPGELAYGGSNVYSWSYRGWLTGLVIGAFVILGAITSIGNLAALIRLVGRWWSRTRTASQEAVRVDVHL